MFGFGNFIFPFVVVGHYFAFPNFPIYFTSILRFRTIGKNLLFYLGHGMFVICGIGVLANAALVSAILCGICVGKSRHSYIETN
jgi:hypothetical protein